MKSINAFNFEVAQVCVFVVVRGCGCCVMHSGGACCSCCFAGWLLGARSLGLAEARAAWLHHSPFHRHIQLALPCLVHIQPCSCCLLWHLAALAGFAGPALPLGHSRAATAARAGSAAQRQVDQHDHH